MPSSANLNMTQAWSVFKYEDLKAKLSTSPVLCLPFNCHVIKIIGHVYGTLLSTVAQICVFNFKD